MGEGYGMPSLCEILFTKEKTMKTLAFTLAFALAAAGGTTHAAEHAHDVSQHQMAAEPATLQGTGVLKAVDAKAGKVQIAHEPIAELGWPAMTMWFALRKPLPGNIKAGDRVRFEMEQAQSKAWAITRIERGR
jgi:Cu/Ag efflux protein CusF